MATQRQLEEARVKFTIRFRRDVLKRIEREREERFAKPASVLNADRDALIVEMGAEGRSLWEIINASEAKGQRVRKLLGMPPARPQPPRRRAAQPAL